MKIHHIGYLVKRLEKAAAAFTALGYEREEFVNRYESSGMHLLFLQKHGYRSELASPYRPDSVVSGLLKTYKNAPYHICYESGDFAADTAALEEGGYLRIGEAQAAPAIGGRKVVFFMHPAMGMIEVLEEKGKAV